MSAEAAISTLSGAFRTLLVIGGPLLLAALVAGIFVGVLQTATQINEASLSFVVKLVAVAAVLLALGPGLLSGLVTYTRTSLHDLADVVR